MSRFLDSESEELSLNVTKTEDRQKSLNELKKAFGSKRAQRHQELNSKVQISTEAIKDNMEKSVLGKIIYF